LGMAVATAALSVSLDVGDRLSREFRSLGANLIVTPDDDAFPVEIGGVNYRPANTGRYLLEASLPKIKTVYWHNNIIAFAPTLDVPVNVETKDLQTSASSLKTILIGTWVAHSVPLADGSVFSTGIDKTNPWWKVVDGRWFSDGAPECVIGSKLQARAGIKIGDELRIQGAKEKVSLRVVGILSTGGNEDDNVVSTIGIAQHLAERPGQYHQLFVSALTKPEDDFARRTPGSMTPDEFERWSCSPYISSIAYSIQGALLVSNVRVIRRVADGEGRILSRVQTLLWLVTFAALLAAALAVGASSAASVIERRAEIGLMKALGAGSGTIGFLLAAEQLLLALAGGAAGYVIGILLARVVGQKIFGVAPQPSLLVLAVIVGLAAVVTLAGSAIPLRRAARYEPAPILRGE
jgi:putative ABC transport system permease protein